MAKFYKITVFKVEIFWETLNASYFVAKFICEEV